MSEDQKEVPSNAEEPNLNDENDQNNIKTEATNSDNNPSMEIIPKIARDDNDDELSSVSTHSSMPGLMSDDDSDVDDMDDDSDNSDSMSEDNNDDEVKTNPLLDTDEERPINTNKSNKTNKKTNKKKSKTNDDWGATIKQGFLNRKKPKKKKISTTKPTTKPIKNKAKTHANKPIETKKDNNDTKDEFISQLRSMGYAKETIERVLLHSPHISTISQFVDYVENVLEMEKRAKEKRLKEEEQRIREDKKKKKGFRLEPQIDANKNAKGNMFICIGPRKNATKLDYNYLKCWVSLKLKLKKKAKKQISYYAVLIDLRKVENEVLRDMEREKLKMGYENVVSFTYNATHGIVDVGEDNERWLTLDRALREYKETRTLRKESKRISELVTAGFDDEEARLALKMSVENDNNMKEKEHKECEHSVNDDNKENEDIKEIKQNEDDDMQNDIKQYEEDDIQNEEESKEQYEDEKEMNAVKVDNAEEVPSTPKKSKRIVPRNETPALISKTDKSIPSTPKTNGKDTKEISETDEISLDLMNLCRFTSNDLISVMDDPEVNDILAGIYIKLKSPQKIYKIEKTMNRAPYLFLNCFTKKGLQILSGVRRRHCKLTEVCDDDFTLDEVIAWKHKMHKDAQILPDKEELYQVSETVKIIRESIDIRNNNETTTGNGTNTAVTQISMSPPISVSPTHSVRSLQQPGAYANYSKEILMARYLDEIDAGATIFWCIPTAQGDSRYCCFLLAKSKKNEKVLMDAIALAKNIGGEYGANDIVYFDIQEFVIESDPSKHHLAKHGRWKSKGVLMDLCNVKAAYNVSLKLKDFMVKNLSQPNHCTNICRLVLSEFGDAYIKAQRGNKHLSKRKNKCRDAAGPKYDYYKTGEPSIETMSQMGSVYLYGEREHSEYSESVTVNFN